MQCFGEETDTAGKKEEEVIFWRQFPLVVFHFTNVKLKKTGISKQHRTGRDHAQLTGRRRPETVARSFKDKK